MTKRPGVTVSDIVINPVLLHERIHKLAMQVPFSLELLGRGRPETPEERADRMARQTRWEDETRAAREALAAVQSPLARAVLDLHAPDGGSFFVSCTGCDYGGYEGEPPAYPCRTVELVARELGIDMPEQWWWSR